MKITLVNIYIYTYTKRERDGDRDRERKRERERERQSHCSTCSCINEIINIYITHNKFCIKHFVTVLNICAARAAQTQTNTSTGYS